MNNARSPLEATCPRCSKPFACGAGSPSPCACNQLQLTDALRQQLRERYTGCLCPACLIALGAEPVTPGSPAAGSGAAATGRWR